MVVRCQRMMEDEEDLEALRLAALQTIKPRQTEPKKMYGHQYYNKYNQYPAQVKKPFIRTDYHNPNLIVIVPTEDNKLTQPSPVQKSAEVIKNGSNLRDSNPVETSIEDKESIETSSEDKESVESVEQKPESSKEPIAKETLPEPSPSKVLPKSKREIKDKDDVMELHFNDDELDFESECIDQSSTHDDEAVTLHVDETDTLSLHAEDSDTLAMHDEDEDSLEKLMDEMEQEFSEETLSKKGKSSKKVLQKKIIPPTVAKKTKSNSDEKKEKEKSKSPCTSAFSEKKKSPVRKYPSPKRLSPPRRASPLRRNSPPKRSPPSHQLSPRRASPSSRSYGAQRSPLTRRSRSPSYRRSRSPARTPPPLLRRSPLPRRSRSPLPNRSRSPFSRRSKSPYHRASPYRKSKSPIRRRTPPPRRFSPLPRRSPRRSPLPLTRRSRSRTRSPPRREYRSRTPVQPRRRSRSPSFLRRSLSRERRRPIRRSVSPRKRSPSPLLGRANVRRRTPPLGPSRRSPPQTRPVRRRSLTPPRRPHTHRLSPRRQPRSARAPELQPRTERPSRGPSPPPSESKMEADYRREPLRKLLPDKENDKKADVPAADVDPKLEARRKKFEMNAPLSLTQKKIYLKTSSEEAVDPTESKHRHRLQDVSGEEVKIKERAKHSPTLFQSPPRVHKAIHTENFEQSGNLSAISTKGSQTKNLLYDEGEKEIQRVIKPTAIRYTVEDAKEEIELMKLKRRRKTEQILEEEGENQQIIGIKKKKKKEKKEKKRSKKKDAELGEMVETKSKASRSGAAVAVARVGASEGQDLRAELSRRRAQRLQGQPGSRLIQSALEGVVADKKIKTVRRDSPSQESGTVDDANKSKARRVHVVPLGSKKKYEDPVEVSSSSESDTRLNSSDEDIETDDAGNIRKTARMTASGILRGISIRRRNQV